MADFMAKRKIKGLNHSMGRHCWWLNDVKVCGVRA